MLHKFDVFLFSSFIISPLSHLHVLNMFAFTLTACLWICFPIDKHECSSLFATLFIDTEKSEWTGEGGKDEKWYRNMGKGKRSCKIESKVNKYRW